VTDTATPDYSERPAAIRNKTPAADLEIGGRLFAFYYPSADRSQYFFAEAAAIMFPLLGSSAANLGRMLSPLLAAIASDMVQTPNGPGEAGETSEWSEESSWDEDPEKPGWSNPPEDVQLHIPERLDEIMDRGKKVIKERGFEGVTLEMGVLEDAGKDLAAAFARLKPKYVRELLEHVWVHEERHGVKLWQNCGGEHFKEVFAGKTFMQHYLVVLMAMGAFWLPFEMGSVLDVWAGLQKRKEKSKVASKPTSKKAASPNATRSTEP
jgi:hypothetical protein